MMRDWRPQASLAMLQQRALLLEKIRAFFKQHHVLEVETPILSTSGTLDPSIASFCTVSDPLGRSYYLHTSPEYAMKRLVAAGYGAIFQITKVFRQAEMGRHHHPEFTMLEWYRPNFSYHELMTEVEALLITLSSHRPFDRLSYYQAFDQYLGIQLDDSVNMGYLRQCALDFGIGDVSGLAADDFDGWCDLLLSHIIAPQLGFCSPVFLYDYPASQAALAQVRQETTLPVAERFELYINGIEMANGYQELMGCGENEQRLSIDRRKRHQAKLPDIPRDEYFLAAMDDLPICAGVALGLDRLLLAFNKIDTIEKTLSFSLMTAKDY